MKSEWVLEVQLYSFFNLGARMAGERLVYAMPQLLYTWERTGNHCTEGWVSLSAGVDGCEKVRPHGIQSPDLPARSDSLYWLSYPDQPK
jgi:hypothetical protein